MTPEATNNSARVDAYIQKHAPWQQLLTKLRKILASTPLEETIKWGSPSYALDGKAIVSLVAFKQHCALWFHQGVFLKDTQNRLSNAQEGRTRAMRQWRFEADSKIETKLVKDYVSEAIANAKAGKQIKPASKALVIPDELAQALAKTPRLQRAFATLTPGKQRQYAEHIAGAKQAQTRLNRLAKAAPLILAGTGLHDKYRNC